MDPFTVYRHYQCRYYGTPIVLRSKVCMLTRGATPSFPGQEILFHVTNLRRVSSTKCLQSPFPISISLQSSGNYNIPQDVGRHWMGCHHFGS